MLAAQSDDIDSLLERGARLSASGFTAEAYRVFVAAYELAPESPRVLNRVGDFLLERGHIEEALALFAMSAELGDVGGLCGLVEVRERRGELEEALSIVDRVPGALDVSLALRVVTARILGRIGRIDEAAALLSEGDTRSLPDRDAAAVHYQLGELHHARGQTERAFAAWRRANSRRHLVFDRAAYESEIDEIVAAWSKKSFASRPRGSDSERPVFIVGVPRSGTSLVEHILAAHPSVHGAGELADINALYPATDTSDPEQVSRAASTYLSRLSGLDRDAKRVIDKMPFNAMRLGFIAQLFPNARVIHCVRDPKDTALSIYGSNFSDWHTYATDLTDIAGYIAGHERMMEHWQEVLPVPILEVEYETLIRTGEPMLRNLVDFVGLPWADAVAGFHASTRAVATASYAQVQRPLYTSSVGRARPYAKHMRSFRSALSRFRQQVAVAA